VRDERGQKMSKSKGNVMDPLGPHRPVRPPTALRFTLAGHGGAKDANIKLATNRGRRLPATSRDQAPGTPSRFARDERMRAQSAIFDPTTVKETLNRWDRG